MTSSRSFLLGAGIIVAAIAFLIASGVRETGVYFLTPGELAARVTSDSTMYDVGVKVGARVVPGSIHRGADGQQVDFVMRDGVQAYPVTYRGLVPDTFTDQSDIEVIVSGRLQRDGTFRATEVLAKCGSRYEATHQAAEA